MSAHSTEDTRPIRMIWLPGIALGALCALLVWPQTHRLVAGQLRLAIPTPQSVAAASPCGFSDPAISEYAWPIIRRYANEHTSDLPQQIAAATTLPPDASEIGANRTSPDGPVSPNYKIKRLQELIQRFPDQPSLYATILRYSTMGKVRVTRDEVRLFVHGPGAHAPDRPSPPRHSLAADVDLFDNECAVAERLDPDNGFFPMMHAIGLFESHNDAEALDAIERASACNHWMEYLDDELDGEISLQAEAFGTPGPVPRATYAAAILLPHLSSIRFASEVAIYEAIQAEQAGRQSDGLHIRTAVRRVGSLMRCQSRNLIGSLVGMNLVKTSLMRTTGGPVVPIEDIFTQKKALDTLLRDYDSYLASAGRTEDSARVHAEIEACVKTKAIISTGIRRSPFDTDLISVLELSIIDMSILATVVWVAALAGLLCFLAGIAGAKPIKKLPRAGRFTLMTCITLASGAATIALLIQQAAGSVGTIAFLGKIWWNLSDSLPEGYKAIHVLSDGYLGIIATIPVLTLVTLAALCLFWRAPIAAGVARGFRACAVPLCSVLVIGYAILAPITSTYERRLDTGLTDAFTHEGRAIARLVGAEWPGIVR